MQLAPDRELDVAIVGAGISGLVCARDLLAAGLRVLVLEKSRGLGGRCATRRMLGQPVDIGLAYYHTDDDELLAELMAVPARLLDGWPHRVAGAGPPCHPAAFRPGQRRLAFAEGVNAFPRHLARHVPISRGARVTRMHAHAGGVTLDIEDGPPVMARDVVLALPPAQAQAILPSQEGRQLHAVHNLLGHVTAHPCITLVLGLPLDTPAPEFDVLYPEDTPLQIVAHDSAKRDDPEHRVLVVQARADWSRAHLEDPPDEWRRLLTEETANLLGDRVRAPQWTDVQRWRYAKVELSTEVGAPLLFGLPGGGRLGLTGESFTLEAGVQGAYRAGRRLAQRILADLAADP
jgi:renalase